MLILKGSKENEDPENEDQRLKTPYENEDPLENEGPLRKQRPPTETKTAFAQKNKNKNRQTFGEFF